MTGVGMPRRCGSEVERLLLVAMFLVFWGLGVYGLIGGRIIWPVGTIFMATAVICVFGAMA